MHPEDLNYPCRELSNCGLGIVVSSSSGLSGNRLFVCFYWVSDPAVCRSFNKKIQIFYDYFCPGIFRKAILKKDANTGSHKNMLSQKSWILLADSFLYMVSDLSQPFWLVGTLMFHVCLLGIQSSCVQWTTILIKQICQLALHSEIYPVHTYLKQGLALLIYLIKHICSINWST